ncbi:MAG: SUMF1/EgtB/PvdO family nonheme iron enzyme [Planctomycetota bacterium]
MTEVRTRFRFRTEAGCFADRESSSTALGTPTRLGALGKAMLTEPTSDLPLASKTEGPVREMRVEAFFLSKFEMTQAQWMHLENGTNPSFLFAGVWASGQLITRRNPVEQVQWSEGARVLRRAGMRYPTEAEWDYAARAGTTTEWFFGTDYGSRPWQTSPTSRPNT